jgi:predicted RNA-binding Zn-ribbon protein involved in translation (DUF1610 family)
LLVGQLNANIDSLPNKEIEGMGLFSKLNFRAVDQAYKDSIALQFISFVSVATLGRCENSDSRIDIGPICDSVAQKIGESFYENADGGLELAAAIKRLSDVSHSIKRNLVASFGQDCVGVEVYAMLKVETEYVTRSVLKAAKKGYLNYSLVDAMHLADRYEAEIQKAWTGLLERDVEQLLKSAEVGKNSSLTEEVEAGSVAAIGDVDVPVDEEDTSDKWLRGEWEFIQQKRQLGRELSVYEKGLEKQYEELQAKSPNDVDEGNASFEWLRDECEFFQKKRAMGRELNSYEKGLVRKYEELQAKSPGDLDEEAASVSHSENTQPIILRCQKCDQSVRVPNGRKLNVTCPKCGFAWVYDGLSQRSEASGFPEDKLKASVDKSDVDRGTYSANRPKSKLQLREEGKRETEESVVINNALPKSDPTNVRAKKYAPLSLPRCPECNQRLIIGERQTKIVCPACGFSLKP